MKCKSWTVSRGAPRTETAVALERMTHRESPWIDARNGLPNGAASDARISKESMKKYYRDLTDKD